MPEDNVLIKFPILSLHFLASFTPSLFHTDASLDSGVINNILIWDFIPKKCQSSSRIECLGSSQAFQINCADKSQNPLSKDSGNKCFLFEQYPGLQIRLN